MLGRYNSEHSPRSTKGSFLAHRDLPNLDLLRSLAVISVVVEHTLLAMKVMYLGRFQVAWIGVVGVFMFFVHTSLVLMWSLERQPDTLSFYIRRAFRIYPLVWAGLLAVALFHAPTSGTPAQYFHYDPPTFVGFAAAMLLLQNFAHAHDYLGVLWSLPYEMQMYVVLPVLFFFVRAQKSIWPLFLLWLLVAEFCNVTFRTDGHNLASVVPYFLPGVMAYVGFERFIPRFPAWTFTPFVAFIWVAFLGNPGWHKGWILCLVLGLGLPFFQQIRLHWLKRITYLIAQYSFGFYLVHPFSIVIGFYLLRQYSLPVRLAAEVGTLIPISIASYHWVEKPMMKLGSRMAAALRKPHVAVTV